MPTPAVKETKTNNEKSNKTKDSGDVNDADATTSRRTNLKPPHKPDDEAYQKSLEEINSKIEKLREQLTSVNEKIENFSNNDSKNQKREELHAQLDRLRGKQAEIKGVRNKTFEQLRVMNESLHNKKKDLRNSKSKLKYKSVEDVDAEIINMEKQIESGNLKIIEERKYIAQISSLKKTRKTVESFAAQQRAIDTEQKAIDDVKKSLENSEMKETNDKFNEIKSQLDAINSDQAVDKQKRNELYDERKRIKELMDEEYNNRKSLQNEHHKAKQEYRNWLDEERRRKAELQRQKKEQFEKEKIDRITKEKLEQASVPAFQDHISTCDTLINYFQTNYRFVKTATADDDNNSAQSLEPESTTNIRKPDATSNVPEGTVLVKKADRDDDYFTGSSKKKKSKDKRSHNTTRQNSSLQLPVIIIEQLDLVKVMIPSKNTDIEKVIEELTEKKKYFIENQDHVTKQNILNAEAEIAALINSSNNNKNSNYKDSRDSNRKRNQQKNDHHNNNDDEKSFDNDGSVVVADDGVDSNKNKAIVDKSDQKNNDSLSTKTEIDSIAIAKTTVTTDISPLTTTTAISVITEEHKIEKN